MNFITRLVENVKVEKKKEMKCKDIFMGYKDKSKKGPCGKTKKQGCKCKMGKKRANVKKKH